MTDSAHPQLSVVVPLYNEEESVPRLIESVGAALRGTDWELVLVDDGSTDRTTDVVAGLARPGSGVRLVRLARNYGQTAAMQAGFDQARGKVIVSMDGDLQNDPGDILRLVAKLDEGYDLVAGYRVRRQDKVISRKIPSWIANRLIRRATGVPIRDNGCSLKAYRREVLERMRLYSDMHRFIPAVAAATAGARIAEVPVTHHARRFGASKYGISRTFKVLADLVTIAAIRSFRDRPLSLFGLAALGATVLGLAFAAASVMATDFRPEKAEALVLPSVSLLWFGLAAYLLLLGLVGEGALREFQDPEEGRPPLARELRP
ncbi:MAG: glycosyltransferase family 2 protein [Gemmatimonadales bacterium]